MCWKNSVEQPEASSCFMGPRPVVNSARKLFPSPQPATRFSSLFSCVSSHFLICRGLPTNGGFLLGKVVFHLLLGRLQKYRTQCLKNHQNVEIEYFMIFQCTKYIMKRGKTMKNETYFYMMFRVGKDQLYLRKIFYSKKLQNILCFLAYNRFGASQAPNFLSV